ncbi:hypothetical protein Pfo_002161 [Paulownia fortunei]|nr:hypothetical protein Pfo_002161 [Paulownia fortunei]
MSIATKQLDNVIVGAKARMIMGIISMVKVYTRKATSDRIWFWLYTVPIMRQQLLFSLLGLTKWNEEKTLKVQPIPSVHYALLV